MYSKKNSRMRKRLSLIFFMISFCSVAGDVKYPVSEIPEEMKNGMYAVIRVKEVRWNILTRGSSVFYVKQAITILNAKAKNYAKVAVGYDKLRAIKTLKATVYDAFGNEIKKLKQNDFRDQSDFDGFSLYSDNRTKSADLAQPSYPYTVEFEYEVQLKYLYSAPDFLLYRDDEISTQNLSYVITYPLELKPRYKLYEAGKPRIDKIEDGKEQLSWKFNNVRPQKFEKLAPDIEKTVPNICVSPVDFEFGGYAGRMDSWKDFGSWQAKLNEGRAVLPELTKQKVKELTKGMNTKEEKARALYQYLQNKTRYVSIQLGIGGLQPFEAKAVDETGYGDCKALSNYMVALLAEAGVKGYYTTIQAGYNESDADPNFPSDQSNHVIVAVPNEADTLWLECTSQTKPFGWMGQFTDDRYALMVTEQGGALVKTPAYSMEMNTQLRSANVVVDVTGNAKAKIKTTYRGLQYENDGLDFMVDSQPDDQRKWIQNNTHIPSFDINSFSITSVKSKIPSAVVNTELTLNRLATVSGKRLFLTPNLMNRSTFIPEKTENRKNKVVRKLAYIDIDSISYNLPEQIYPEFLPEPTMITSRFGEYEANYKLDQGKLIYIRKVKMNKGEFPPESYAELIEFYRNLNKADNTKIVFLTKT